MPSPGRSHSFTKKPLYIVLVSVFNIWLFFMALNFYEFDCWLKFQGQENDDLGQIINAPTYMLHGNNVDSGYLKHVKNVLDRLGLIRTQNDSSFDLLWSHVYPFGEEAPFPPHVLKSLRPFQKVNHFPGSGYFTNKVDLSVTDMKYIPKAFQLPSEKDKLLEYAKQHQNISFVQKSNGHRGIKLVHLDQMNLDQSGTFAQEYISNPLLVDGYKFDIGIYTILTSVDPLRVYIYDGEVLLRFCPKKYEPFDPEDVDKYVVGDDYIPTWEMPSLQMLYNDLKFGMKESLNAYLRSKGLKPQRIWDQIEESIRLVFLKKEASITRSTNRFKNDRNFFEMARFDFVVDSELNVYLMEANMSPNLSSEHFKPNKLLYENVLYNLFALVGVGRRIHSQQLGPRSTDEEKMEVSIKNLVTFSNECMTDRCDSCGSPPCLMCHHCLTKSSIDIFRQAYLEHINRLDCKRVFPPSMKSKMKIEDLNLEEYSPENRVMILWFLGKCKQDSSWC